MSEQQDDEAGSATALSSPTTRAREEATPWAPSKTLFVADLPTDASFTEDAFCVAFSGFAGYLSCRLRKASMANAQLMTGGHDPNACAWATD